MSFSALFIFFLSPIYLFYIILSYHIRYIKIYIYIIWYIWYENSFAVILSFIIIASDDF